MQSDKRIVWLDYIRVLACYMVIAAHSPLQTRESDICFYVINYLTSPCVGLFFMISGALLLPIKDQSVGIFIKNRLSKVGIPLLVWSLFYAVISWLWDGNSLGDALIALSRVPVKPIRGPLWFVYALVGLYLFSPIISPWLKQATKTDLQYYLIIWGFTLVLPYLNIFIPGAYSIQGSINNAFFQFSGYLGYFLLGYYLNRFALPITKVRHWFYYGSLLLFICTVFPVIVFFYGSGGIDNSLWGNYLTINVAFMCIAIFTVAQKIKIGNTIVLNVLIDFSRMSFGIYLAHIFVLRNIVRPWYIDMYYLPNIIQIPLMALTVLLASYAIVKMISFLPKSKWLIGV